MSSTINIKTENTTNAPVEHYRILTMETPRISAKGKENKQVIKCLWTKLLGWKHSTELDNFNKQFSRALADEQGFNHKGCKSEWTDKLQSQYQIAEPIESSTLDTNIILINAMFLINAKPLRRTKINEWLHFIVY